MSRRFVEMKKGLDGKPRKPSGPPAAPVVPRRPRQAPPALSHRERDELFAKMRPVPGGRWATDCGKEAEDAKDA